MERRYGSGRGQSGQGVPSEAAPATRANHRLTVEYDGTRYGGFQEQPNARTVAGELRAALVSLLGEPVTLFAAGRTDAGVHAEGQVVNFLSRRRLAPRELLEGLNDRLPADICVLEAGPAPADFHARSWALARTYRYQVSRRRDAFRKRFVWWVRSPLDLGRMATAAAAVVGFHDFRSFTDPEEEDATARVVAAAWSESEAEAGSLLVFRVTADHFRRKMVRRLVGGMVAVGLGRAEPGVIHDLLKNPRPGGAAEWTAPPSGLFLERIEYAGAAPRRSGRGGGHARPGAARR